MFRSLIFFISKNENTPSTFESEQMERELHDFFSCSQYFQQPAIASHIISDITSTVSAFDFLHRVAIWGETGQRKLCLYGGLPFAHKGKKFNAPIQIWISSSYPIEAPTCFIVPSPYSEGSSSAAEQQFHSQYKLVSYHPAVDGTGLVYSPFLAEWSPRKSLLKPLIMHLSSIFSERPPVYEVLYPIDRDAGGIVSKNSFLPTENKFDQQSEAEDCVVCLSFKRDTVLIPCGHYTTCNSCAGTLTQCPICRVSIQYRQRVF